MKDDWTKTDNAQFANMSDFDDLKTILSILPDEALYLMGDNIFQLLEKEDNNFQS